MEASLSQLKVGQRGTISKVGSSCKRLLELGFVPGTQIQVLHETPWGGTNIVVKIRNTLFAFRREDAKEIEVQF